MTAKTTHIRVLTAVAAAALLAACSGGGGTGSTSSAGGGSGGSGSDNPTPAAATLSGVIASGAAFTEGTVQVTDSTGAVVGTSTAVGADGSYTVTLAAGARAPFVLVASRTTADGETQSMVSVADTASSSGNTTVNVTPVTTLIAARLSPTGDPLALASAVQANPQTASAAAVATAVADVNAVLAPVLTATGTSTVVNPLTVTFTPNGSGYDRVLDSIHVTVTPDTSTSTRVEVGFKAQQTDASAQPQTVQFASNAPTATLQQSAAAVTLSASDLVPDGTSALIADFLSALTACYALPLEVRVNNASSSDSAVVGSASNVSASECKSIFVGSNPGSYLSNGSVVERTASNTGAFAGLFRRGATGVVFSQGSYEFTRVNGDLVIGYKTRDTTGAEGFDTLVVRKNAASGKLQAIGNQYAYGGGIQAYHQVRHFITKDSTGASQTSYDYSSTGYTVSVPNTTDGAGNPIFDRVVVTTPRGTQLLLKPSTGMSYLPLVKSNGTVTSTSFVRLRSTYLAGTTTGHPKDLDTNLFFALTDFTDDQLAAIPNQAVWKYDYYLAGNVGSTPDATQHYKTRTRALTLAELSLRPMARLTDATLSTLLARTQLYNQILLPNDASLSGLAYTVPTGALPPTSLQIWGRKGTAVAINGTRFDDSNKVASTATTGTVTCSPATNSDTHCNAVVNGAFANYTYMNGLHLWSKDASGREFAKFYAMYQLK